MRIVNKNFDFSNYVLDRLVRIDGNIPNPFITESFSEPTKITPLMFPNKTAALPTAIISRNRITGTFTKTPISKDVLASITQYLPDEDALKLAIHEKNPDLYFFNRKNIRIKSRESLEKFIELFTILDPNDQKKFQVESLDLSHRTDVGGPLFIGGIMDVATASIIRIVKKCPQLHTLKVNYCGGLGDTSLIEIVKNCPQLRSLDVSHCAFTADSLIEIVKNCSQLRILNATHRSVTDASYIACIEIITICPKLHIFNTRSHF